MPRSASMRFGAKLMCWVTALSCEGGKKVGWDSYRVSTVIAVNISSMAAKISIIHSL